MLAKQLGQESPFPSLEFATEDFTGYVGGCTPGFSCAYMNTISWASPTTPLPMEISPRNAFERLFGDGGSAAERRAQVLEDKSILDAIVSEARALHARLGAGDRGRLGNYLDNVREIERRIQQIEAQNSGEVTLIDKPLGTPESFADHSALMFDLLAMAFQADLTRVFTFMMSREASQRTFSEIGVSDPWHVVSHHGEQAEKIARNAKVNVYCLEMLAKFAEKLKADAGRRRHPAGSLDGVLRQRHGQPERACHRSAADARARRRRRQGGSPHRAGEEDGDRQPVAERGQSLRHAAGEVRGEHGLGGAVLTCRAA